MEFYIATNIYCVLQTKRRFIPFSPTLILLNHTDNILCCDFDISLTLIFAYHSSLESTFQRKAKQMEICVGGCIMHLVSVISAHPFNLCLFENPSLDIYVAYFCTSFNICWGQVLCTKRWMHSFLQIIIDKFHIAICLKIMHGSLVIVEYCL